MNSSMKARIALAVYYLAIGFLVVCAIVIVYKLMFWPICSSTMPKGAACSVGDSWTIAGVTAAILGITATVLAILGAFAVAYWWTGLEERVSNQVEKLYEEKLQAQRTAVNNSMKALVYLALGDRLLSQGRNQDAVATYRKVGSLMPEISEINYILGRIYSGAGYFDDAITALKAVLSVNPDSAEAEMELGLTYCRRGEAQKGPDSEVLRNTDYDEALVHLKRSVDLHPNYEDALAGLGAVYQRKGDNERNAQHTAEANQYFQLSKRYYLHAQIANPTSSNALRNVASLSWYLGEKDSAVKYFILAQVAAEVHTKNVEGSSESYRDYFDLALAQLVLGEINRKKALKDEAIQVYKIAISRTPGPVLINSELNNLYLLQKAQESIDRLDIVISMLEEAKLK